MKWFLSLVAACALAQSSRDAEIARIADPLREKLVEQRRDFHMHPELSNREERTGRVIAERLRAIGFEDVKAGVARTGVVAILKGGKPGAVVAVRADIDALPVEETLNVPYKSLNPGVKHACGHDVHITVQLGVAEVLWKMRSQISGTIKFIFQPAEESPPVGEEGGALLMVKQGVLLNPAPQAIFGLHTNPVLQAGTIGYTSGNAMASADRFVIKLKGKKVHAMAPHQGIDTVVVAAEAVQALQTIRSRRIDPSEPAVLTIGSIHGGNRFNIITDEVVMEGTIRTLDEDVRGHIHKLMGEILDGITKANGASFSLEFIPTGFSVVYNDPPLTEKSLPTLRRVIGAKNVVATRPSMGAEDFSQYTKTIPGFFYWLGVGNREKGITGLWHTPEFDADEDSLLVGVKAMSAVLLDYLDREKQ